MCRRQSKIDEIIARMDADYKEELLSVFKGEKTPRDEFEKHLVEATKIRNNVDNHKYKTPSLALKDALRHLEEARKYMPNSSQRDVLGDIVGALESEINQMMKLEAYNEIMSALLQAYEAHPEMDVEEIIAQVAREMGASEKSLDNIKKTSAILDKFQEKKTVLEAAHEDGETTKKWILAETEKLTEGRSDKERAAIAEGVAKAVDRGVQQSISGDEPTKKEE